MMEDLEKTKPVAEPAMDDDETGAGCDVCMPPIALVGAEDYDYGYNENRNVGHDCGGTPKTCLFDFWHDRGTGADIHQQVFYSTNYYTTRSIEIVRNHTRDKPTQP